MAGRIRIEPYKPLDLRTPPVPGGGYIQVDASVGKFSPSPLLQLFGQPAEGGAETADIADIVARLLARDDEAMVKDADARLGEAEQALLFDLQDGYLNSQGPEVVVQAATALETYGKAQEREAETLENDAQRRMLKALAQRRMATFGDRVERHSAAERLRWHDMTSDRRIALMQADAGFNWSDDSLLRRALGTVRAEVRDKAERHGWASPLTEAALRQQTSRTLVLAIEAAVERDPDRAHSLRTRYDQHIEAADRAALDALLAEAQTRQRAQQASTEILNSAPHDGKAPTLQWRLQQAEVIAEPAVREATLRTLHAAAAATEARARALAEQALARVLKDGLTDSSQIPVREWVALDAGRRQAIETRLDHNAAGTEPAANPALVDELATQMTEAPAAFARRDLVPSVAHLPLQQWQRFRDLQAGIRRNDPATEDELYAIKRGLRLATKALPSDTPDDDVTSLRSDIVDEIGTWLRINGRSSDDTEINDMLGRHGQLAFVPSMLDNKAERPPHYHRIQSRNNKPGVPVRVPTRPATDGPPSFEDKVTPRQIIPEFPPLGLPGRSPSTKSAPTAPAPKGSAPQPAPQVTPSSPPSAPLSPPSASPSTVPAPRVPPKSSIRGHHYIPQAVYNRLGLSSEALEVFQRATTGVLVPGVHYNDEAHRRYSAAVEELARSWIKQRAIVPSKMTGAEALEFLDYVKGHGHPDIKDYLEFLKKYMKQSYRLRDRSNLRGIG